MLPDKTTMCHRTGFAKPCHECVTQHGCKLWQRVAEIVDRDPETGEAIAKDKYDCLDALQGMFWKDMLRRQLQTTATVDKLAKEVSNSNAGAMGAILGGVNQQLRAMQQAQQQAIAHMNGDAPKMIEGSAHGDD